MTMKTWEIRQSANDPNAIDMYIYGDVQSDSFDWWAWETVQSETSAEYFRQELNKYPDAKTINLYVNSMGGSVYEAMAIRNQLKRHEAKVIGYVDGFAASAASFILTACDEVKMYSNTMQMVHNMWNIVAGNANQLRKAADDLDTIMAGNRQAYLEKSEGKLTEEILIKLLDEETWLTAQQCYEYGLCDEIIAKEADMAGAKQLMQKMNTTFEQQIKLFQSMSVQARAYLEPLEKTPQEPKQSEPAVTNFMRFKQAFIKKENGGK